MTTEHPTVFETEEQQDFGKSILRGRSYRVQNNPLLPWDLRRQILALKPWATIIVPDQLEHPLNAEDSGTSYLRAVQQRVLAFARGYRHTLTLATRRVFDEERDCEVLYIIHTPKED